MISVLIPTANRPDYLRHSLESVIYQSRKDLIGEVIVSNNGTISVADVVSSFTSLPIQFIEQSEKLRPGAHFEWLVNRARFPMIAMLADDDMWGRYHLEEAHRLLSRSPDAVAVFTQTVAVKNASRQPIGGLGELAHSLIETGNALFDEAFIFKTNEILIDCLIRTPLDVWAMVGRKESISKHMNVFSDNEAGADSDRFFIWRLNTEGPIIAAREIGLFMRVHAGMAGLEIREKDSQFHRDKSKSYTLKMIEEAKVLGIPVKEVWKNYWEAVDSERKRNVMLGYSYVREASQILGYLPLQNDLIPMRNRVVGVLKDLSPPLFFRGLRRFYRHMSDQ
jgi:glycosyltransferase involved in cell wall biosynthesis